MYITGNLGRIWLIPSVNLVSSSDVLLKYVLLYLKLLNITNMHCFYARCCTFLVSCCLQQLDGMRTPSFPFKWEWCFSFNVRITQLWEFRRASARQQEHYEEVHQILNKISRQYSIKQCYCMHNTEKRYMIYSLWLSRAYVKPQTQRTSSRWDVWQNIRLSIAGFTTLTKAK